MSEIRICCRLTERQYRDYMKFHVLGNKKSVGAHLILSLLIVLFGLMNFQTKSPVLGWIFVTLGIYFLISRYFRFYTSVNRITEQFGLSSTPKLFYTLTFRDDGFDVKNEKEQAHYPVERICRACFRKKEQMIYLYLTKTNAFLLPYEGFEEGTPDDLQAQIREKCGGTVVEEFE